MLIRALFWIGVVVLFMPGGMGIPSGNSMAGEHSPTAASSGFRGALLERLATVKADIEAAERRRAGGLTAAR